jgi:hypothetical protein
VWSKKKHNNYTKRFGLAAPLCFSVHSASLSRFVPFRLMAAPSAQLAWDSVELVTAIKHRLNDTLNSTSLLIGRKVTGKVRDVYETDNHIVLVTTDRLSAFDRVLASVPFKGAVLNQVSAYWFDQTKHIVPNHIVAVPHPNVTVAKKCTPFKIEFVVRAYLTGSTSTSIWVHYNKGARTYCGHALSDGTCHCRCSCPL